MTRKTKRYKDYIKSEAWRRLRERIFNVRGRRCERCGIRQYSLGLDRKPVYLQLHHKTYERLGNEYDSDVEVLCMPCHKLADKERKRQLRIAIRTRDKAKNRKPKRTQYKRKKYGT